MIPLSASVASHPLRCYMQTHLRMCQSVIHAPCWSYVLFLGSRKTALVKFACFLKSANCKGLLMTCMSEASVALDVTNVFRFNDVDVSLNGDELVADTTCLAFILWFNVTSTSSSVPTKIFVFLSNPHIRDIPTSTHQLPDDSQKGP